MHSELHQRHSDPDNLEANTHEATTQSTSRAATPTPKTVDDKMRSFEAYAQRNSKVFPFIILALIVILLYTMTNTSMLTSSSFSTTMKASSYLDEAKVRSMIKEEIGLKQLGEGVGGGGDGEQKWPEGDSRSASDKTSRACAASTKNNVMGSLCSKANDIA